MKSHRYIALRQFEKIEPVLATELLFERHPKVHNTTAVMPILDYDFIS